MFINLFIYFCIRTFNECWKVLENQETLETYGDILARFLKMVLSTLTLDEEDFKLNLSKVQWKAVQEAWKGLQK